MLIIRDLYTQVVNTPIDSSGAVPGQTIIQYEVREYTDTRNSTETKSYVVTCTQRLILPNPNPYTPSAGNTLGFREYPALVTNNIAISDPNGVIQDIMLLNYTPRTLNTAVSTNQSSGQSSDLSVSQQYTAGSSTAQTNSYGVSSSVGFFGDAPTGGISASSETSETTERSFSLSDGNAVDHGSQLSNSNSMSIKDWGSYSSINPLGTSSSKFPCTSLTWVWGQEYPWNVIKLKNTDSNGNVVLPAYVSQRLYDGTQVYPPSELSLFGVDFVCKASWLITPNAGEAQSEEITFNHNLTYGAASHFLAGEALTVNLSTNGEPFTYSSSVVDLAVLALDPIRSTDRHAAIIGFVLNQFDVPPTPKNSAFSITAEANNLLVRGQGFTGIMTTDFSSPETVQMTAYFKIVDSASDISLSLKHWVLDSTPCTLTIVVNGNSDATITKFVDAPEVGSGGDNVMVIALRKKDFTSVDYCDYLQMGLNTIEITLSPVGSSSTTTYSLLAMAVG